MLLLSGIGENHRIWSDMLVRGAPLPCLEANFLPFNKEWALLIVFLLTCSLFPPRVHALKRRLSTQESLVRQVQVLGFSFLKKVQIGFSEIHIVEKKHWKKIFFSKQNFVFEIYASTAGREK